MLSAKSHVVEFTRLSNSPERVYMPRNRLHSTVNWSMLKVIQPKELSRVVLRNLRCQQMLVESDIGKFFQLHALGLPRQMITV